MMRQSFFWLSFFLVSSALQAAEPRSPYVALRSGMIDTRIVSSLTSLAGVEGPVLVKLAGPATASQRQQLEDTVAAIYAYLPDDTFLVRPRSANLAALEDVGAVWVGTVPPQAKLSPALDITRGGSADDRFAVLLHLLPDGDLEAARQAIQALVPEGVVGHAQGRRFSRLRLLLSAADIERYRDVLAQRADVVWIELENRRVLLNDTTIWVGQSGLDGGQATPIFDQGIHGEGQVVAVLDTGIDPDSCFFRDASGVLPPTNPCDGGTLVDPTARKIIATNFLADADCDGGTIAGNEWDNHGHGSHVAGTVASDNLSNPIVHDPGDGMAPGAQLVIQDGGFAPDNCADLPGLGCPVVDLVPIFQQTYDQGARIHTNSWGDRENFFPPNIYSAGSEDADEMMWTHRDFLLVFAAGNSGPNDATVGSPSTAKSVLSVGATQRAAAAGSIASFSSCGPVDDGRIKPEITAPGVSIISASTDNNTGTNNCGTTSSSGTSMAAPGVAGLAALARQYFTDGFYPSGAATPADGFVPSGALLRATVVHSATPMENLPPVPSNCQGWGRVTLDRALAFDGGDFDLLAIDENGAGLTTGEEQTFQFEVQAGQPLRLTLAWTDFPASPGVATHLVNDLDLILEGPDGQRIGNALSAGQSTIGGSADRLNTLEKILIAAPVAGTYTARVSAFNAPQGPQTFALVVTGDLELFGIFTDGFESGDFTAWSSAP
ncbi:MAG: S8 family serine peptidase [Acidobacteriota bacterium]